MYDSLLQPSLYEGLQILEPEHKPFTVEERLRAINKPLLNWYESHARILPWREEPLPYRVWISEIMLQQTRVEAVKPYFERFMEALPTVQDLANVSEDRLMKLWEGLGYYNRAKNLQKSARMIIEEFGGEIPSQFEELLKLPGIGTYTAGAISSIAFDKPVPAVDGNVLRVLSRLLGSKEDILKQSTKRWMEQELAKTMPQTRASHFNQGLIEIGAIVCVPNGQPKCDSCPLASLCIARKEHLIGEIPVKTPPKKRRIEERTVLILETNQMVAIRKRPDQGLLASLYELPNVEGHYEIDMLEKEFLLEGIPILEIEALPKAKHIFSHVEWHMIAYRVILKDVLSENYLFIEKEQLKIQYPLPNAFAKYTKLIK